MNYHVRKNRHRHLQTIEHHTIQNTQEQHSRKMQMNIIATAMIMIHRPTTIAANLFIGIIFIEVYIHFIVTDVIVIEVIANLVFICCH